jgi:hypothetical protein
LTVSELSGNEFSLFSDEESHLAWAYFEFRPSLDASIAWEVPCTGTGTLDCAFAGGLIWPPSRTSDEYALVPGIGACVHASARRGVTSKR